MRVYEVATGAMDECFKSLHVQEVAGLKVYWQRDKGACRLMINTNISYT